MFRKPVYQVWIDLDGVLANWHASACSSLSITYPTRTIFHRDWVVDQTGEPIHTLLDRMDAHPRFWEDMSPYDHFANITTFLDTHFPTWGILTKATIRHKSWGGKAAWVQRFLGEQGMHRLMMTGGPKHRLAHPCAILIDDTDYQVDGWRQHRGIAFRWREYSTDMPEQYAVQVAELFAFLKPYSALK